MFFVFVNTKKQIALTALLLPSTVAQCIMIVKNQQKVAEILREIHLYRYKIRTEREYVMECEDEMAFIRDEMRFQVLSKARKLDNRRELKELVECVWACKGSIGRNERWIKRKFKLLLN